jgi:hypothetical protein
MRVAQTGSPRSGLALALVSLLCGACSSPTSTPYTPGLGEFMTAIQLRHIKLWFAGAADNWPLADYEVHELEEELADAAHFHPTHEGVPRPLTELIPELTGPPIRTLRAAISAHDAASFANAYDSLTAGCNGCHRASGFAFNVVSRPTTNPYSDQEFRAAQ